MIASSDAEYLGLKALEEVQQLKAIHQTNSDPNGPQVKQLANRWTRLEELHPITLGQIAWYSTAQNLQALGYSGARSNSRLTIRPFIAAGLERYDAESKANGILLSSSEGQNKISLIMDELLLKVLDEIVHQNLQELTTKPENSFA